MRALVVGAGEESIHAISVAQAAGCHVTAFDGSGEAKGLKVADQAHVVDITDPGSIAKLCEQPPDFIVPVPVGRVLTSTGALNDTWGTPGISLRSANLCTDKYEFASRLYSKGMRQARCALGSSVLSNPEIIENWSFPIIVKPRFGSGSRGVRLVTRKVEAIECLRETDVECIVEEAFEGQEYGLDGIVHEGELSVLLIRHKVNTPAPICQCIGYQTVTDDPELYALACNRVQEVISILGFTEALVHVDLMINESSVFIIEISGRPSGHNIHSKLLPLATGIDPIEAFIKVCVLNERMPSIAKRRSLFMGFFDFGNCIVKHLPSESEIEKEFSPLSYEVFFSEGDRLEAVVDGSVTKRGYFILEGEASALPNRARALTDRFHTERTDQE